MSTELSQFVSARGGKKPGKPLVMEIVRELTEQDMKELSGVGHSAAPQGQLVALRHGHHMLAQALAKGMTPGEASLVTGYSSPRISVLLAYPAFKELVAHYQSLVDDRFVDAVERMKQLGLTTLEELQERIDTAPESFTHNQLMEMTQLLLVKAQQNGQGGHTLGNAGMNIEVKFIGASSPVIDGKVF